MDKTELDNLLKKGTISLKEYEDGIDILNGKKKGPIIIKGKSININDNIEIKNDVIETELSYEEEHLKLLQSILDYSKKTAENTRFIVNYIIAGLVLGVIYFFYVLVMLG